MPSATRPALSARLAAAIKAFRFGGSGGGGGSTWTGLLGFGGPWGLLPGTRYDYRREAGLPHLNGVVLTAINWIRRTWTEAPFVIHRPVRGDKPDVLMEHPALELLARPNRYYDDSVLWSGTLTSLLTYGNSFWFKERAGGGNVVGLVYIPHWQIAPLYPKDGSAFISGYRYQIDGEFIDYPESEIVHLRYGMDIASPRMGLSPLAAELRSIATDNEIANFSACLLRNMGIPGVIISPAKEEIDITPDQRQELKKQYQEAFTGDGRGGALFPSLPIKVDMPAFSPDQLALDKLARLTIPRICAAIGLDPLMLGLPSDSKTYANVGEAREAAYEGMLIPLQAEISSQLTNQLLETGDVIGTARGDRYGRNYSAVRVLQEDTDALFKRLTAAVGGPWMSRNEAREQIGLVAVEGGDELYEPRGAGGFGAGEEEREEPPALPRAAGRSPDAVKRAIGEKWRLRAKVRELERKALPPAGPAGA